MLALTTSSGICDTPSIVAIAGLFDVSRLLVQAHSPIKPVLVFVSSRRQTRLTALDLLGYAAGDERPRQFVHCPEEELDQAVATIKVLEATAHGCMQNHPQIRI